MSARAASAHRILLGALKANEALLGLLGPNALCLGEQYERDFKESRILLLVQAARHACSNGNSNVFPAASLALASLGD